MPRISVGAFIMWSCVKIHSRAQSVWRTAHPRERSCIGCGEARRRLLGEGAQVMRALLGQGDLMNLLAHFWKVTVQCGHELEDAQTAQRKSYLRKDSILCDVSSNGYKWVEQRYLGGSITKIWEGLDVGSKLRGWWWWQIHQVWVSQMGTRMCN